MIPRVAGHREVSVASGSKDLRVPIMLPTGGNGRGLQPLRAVANDHVQRTGAVEQQRGRGSWAPRMTARRRPPAEAWFGAA
ncbi:hypothetical protein OG331_44645 [Streptomyces sp. NBC_01017]|uniref:hypothetical protein n=1 Tax=Streptomyces sp. NBC_01017 TaxID=2903721 RepID=UPI0038707C1F|nr:hypothetical protein OG331_44645 [Streptomyces sp. NBC_01017]